jgi:hypothetical protein
MTWKDSTSYSNRNTYTEIVKNVVAEKLKEFAKEVNKIVDEKLVAECMQYAVDKIKGINKIK